MKNSYVSKSALLVISSMCLLSACGDTTGQRALSGGAIGAGIGTVGGAILAADPVTGAVLGAAAGALTGAATSKNEVNFGDIK
jgi:hypothetical protein